MTDLSDPMVLAAFGAQAVVNQIINFGATGAKAFLKRISRRVDRDVEQRHAKLIDDDCTMLKLSDAGATDAARQVEQKWTTLLGAMLHQYPEMRADLECLIREYATKAELRPAVQMTANNNERSQIVQSLGSVHLPNAEVFRPTSPEDATA